MIRGALVAAVVLVLGLLIASAVVAQTVAPVPWIERTAHIRPGHFTLGLVHASSWSTGRRVELSSRLWLLPLHPNLAAKIAWGRRDGRLGTLHLASRHEVHVPTPWLRALAREGYYGLLPSDSSIPWIVASTHEFLATRALGGGVLFTTRVGFRTAWRAGPETMPTIDVPVLSPRTAPYHGRFVFQGGIDLHARLSPRAGLVADATFFIIPTGVGLFAFEQTGVFTWRPARRVTAGAGYLFIFGEYPRGTAVHVLPIIDLAWTIRP